MRITRTTFTFTFLVSAIAFSPAAVGCDAAPEAEERNEAVSEPAPITHTKESLTDERIEEAIQRELFYDPSVAIDGLKVSVTNGVVALTGNVQNLLARSRATHIASAVKGVRAISNRLQVNVPDRDDDFVKSAVAAALALDPTTERLDVTTHVQDQVVTLTGTVQSRPEQVWAERAARSVIGVKDVKNDINVEYRSNRRDAEIQEDVEARLRWDSVINDGLIDAKVDNGYVMLSGVIGTLAEKDRAERNAWVAGVKGVDSRQLQVEWWAKDEQLRKNKYVTKSDEEIQRAVKDALLFDPRVNSFTIAPKISNGVARLQGTVSTLAAKNAAEQIAAHTVGVVRVENAIEVDPGSVLDPALEARLSQALKHNVITEAYEIEVDVDHGKATLDGTVQNFAEKSEAEIVATSLPGITEVENKLRVVTPVAFVLEFESVPEYPYVATWASRRASAPLKADLEIKNDIEQELDFSPYVQPDSIKVEVEHGVATLSGKTRTLREQEAAIANAYQGGAVDVQNKLTLQ